MVVHGEDSLNDGSEEVTFNQMRKVLEGSGGKPKNTPAHKTRKPKAVLLNDESYEQEDYNDNQVDTSSPKAMRSAEDEYNKMMADDLALEDELDKASESFYKEQFGEPYKDEQFSNDNMVGSSLPVKDDLSVSRVDEDEEYADAEDEPQTALTKSSEGQSIRKQIEDLLMRGYSVDEIVEAGFNKRSAQTIASELKKKLSNRNVGKQMMPAGRNIPVVKGGAPPELLIESISLPDVANGHGQSFEQGLKFGMSVLILGVRMVQELATIGAQQAKPIIEMSKSMRAGEAEAAKAAATDAAMEAAGMVQQSLMPILSNIQQKNAVPTNTSDPMKNMMANAMSPIFQNMMGSMMSMLPGAKNQQANAGSQPPPANGGNSIDGTSGWSRRSE